RAKFTAVLGAHGRLGLALKDFGDFEIAYRRIGNLRKEADLDGKRFAGYWAEECEVWAQSVGLGVRRMALAAYLAAAIAHGVRLELREPLGQTRLGLSG